MDHVQAIISLICAVITAGPAWLALRGLKKTASRYFASNREVYA